MILALEYHRSPARYLAASRLPGRFRSAAVPSLAPLRLTNREAPGRPGPDWVRLRPVLSGICGSDLSMAAGKVSPYLSPLVSMPFVPGHEVVGELLDDASDDMPAGTRVVIDPVLPCRARGTGPCPPCAEGNENRCDHITSGRISSGLQTGFCADTGGGWSERLVAHRTQLHRVPESLPSVRAVLAEPLACAVRSVRRIDVPRGASIVVVGAGTVGLLTVLALRELTPAGSITVIARHAGQRRRAIALGATETIDSSAALRGLRRITGGSLVRPELGPGYLLGGADIVVECTGGEGLDTALRLVRAGGTVLLSGMPAKPVDLTPAWFRELNIVGSYASRGADDFGSALDLASHDALDGFVDSVYPLTRWRDALSHALSAGRSGSVKIAFDPQNGDGAAYGDTTSTAEGTDHLEREGADG
ncbi:threonine dehydrogenase-like Zn-dependent dehydrogenase [Actinomadura pelletieri DSM 43383]|uniref:Threonine dehydrogenase-like Zn-dependent dehydrogenase n=1 Tax=Actinomadura pelletieri DSM 43383 TaxID=1120940 RepID=A0A495QXZ0_9ACTN|nr:alcohol dehydrogenase catalytic domain-containing protein [Actinomadura pelletieri]RKS79065.1 threonine dehydrogenase-like Zn-dependent dehydrogenase [Actinomadura pelletieri DSM 43383]